MLVIAVDVGVSSGGEDVDEMDASPVYLWFHYANWEASNDSKWDDVCTRGEIASSGNIVVVVCTLRVYTSWLARQYTIRHSVSIGGLFGPLGRALGETQDTVLCCHLEQMSGGLLLLPLANSVLIQGGLQRCDIRPEKEGWRTKYRPRAFDRLSDCPVVSRSREK
jgi:hypothetical protein